ncbi:GTP-binding protein [Marinobacterium lutimaris]|uniref:Signal recognition particle receptor subunit beta, a GTPase n=1 Tax=Marinobacterium lutimaris TaxID=568106 RepID=A0A1H6C1X9_9GAMM|nr:ATP/GTP-binding protein [Marinobacterium lutimaris]SEG66958.1 Signal recognition particle receptor subunit beta, a GTPase [Marinobacterium lutimaris]
MADYKILFTGSVCSGKTTAIRSLSDIETIDTDASVSDSAIRRKQKTTIAMDYGVLEMSDSARLHLYGTPGQERFRFMWQLMMSDLVHDAKALVLLVDNTRNDPFKDIKFYLDEFRDYLVQRQLIIAVTHSDQQAHPDHAYYMNELKNMGIFTTVLFIDARYPDSVLEVIKAVLAEREPSVDWDELGKRLMEHRPPVIEDQSCEASESEQQEQIEQEKKPAEIKLFNAVSLMDAAMNTRGITGAMHLGADRKVLETNISSMQNQAMLKSMVNLVSALEQKVAFLGHIDNLVLCGPEHETLSVFVEERQALGLCSEKELSLSVVKQQAMDLLQWSGE